MIAWLLPAPHCDIDTASLKAGGSGGVQEQVIHPQPGTLVVPSVEGKVPVRVNALRRVQRAQCVRPTGGEQGLVLFTALGEVDRVGATSALNRLNRQGPEAQRLTKVGSRQHLRWGSAKTDDWRL